MTVIKLLLLFGVAVFGLLAYRGARTAGHRVLWRLTGVALIAGAAVAVVLPDAVTELARLLGVGRGADLVLYVLAVSFLVVTVSLMRRINDLETRYVTLVRQQAIFEAQIRNRDYEGTHLNRGRNDS